MKFILKNENKNSRSNYESAIIGAGPAGLTAAVYLGRSKIDTIIFENLVPGGYITSADYIENYPGFPDGISGEKLAELFSKHASNFGATIENREVIGIDINASEKIIKTQNKEFIASTIVIATGTKNRKLGIPGEEELIGKGISLCATCDAPFFEGEEIIVIGAGNSGIQESLYLLKFVKSIKIIEILDHPTAEKILIDRLEEKDNVEIILSHKATKFIGEDKLTGVEVENINTKEKKILDINGAFIYAGVIPNTEFLKGVVDMDSKGFIKTDNKLNTSREGIFAAGDVRTTQLRQVATAVGDGALAAYGIREYLEKI
jgi:thioredoxin reductase (NADPH)